MFRINRQSRRDVVENDRVEPGLPRQRVGQDDPDVGILMGRLGRQGEHSRVDVDGHHRRGVLGHQGGHRPCPRPDFENDILGAKLGGLDDQVMNVQVDQEILPEPMLGSDPLLGEQHP